jgi:type IV secretion system protein TrbL
METLPRDLGFLTALLKALIENFTLGTASLIPELMGLLTLLTILEVLIAGLWYLHSRDLDLGALAMKLAGITVLGWIITEWPRLIRVVLKTFVHFGLRAGGDTISETDFTDPSNILWYGLSVAVTVTTHLGQYTGMDAVYNAVEVLTSLPLGVVIMVLYFVLAVWIFVVLLEFYACTALAVTLLPFGAFRLTAFLAEKAFAYLAAAGIQVMALAFITASLLPVMVRLQGGLHPTFQDLALQLCGALTLCLMAWRVNRFAATLLQGAPQLTMQDVTRAAAATARTVTTLGGGAAAGVGGGTALLQRRRP